MDLERILDRSISFHRCLVETTGSITAALMLSQALYWTPRSSTKDGWFYKSEKEWNEETGMTRTEQEGARKKLRQCGFWQEDKRGIPCRLFYRVDMDKLAKSLGISVSKCADKFAGNLQTRKQETRKQATGKPASYKESEITQRLLQKDNGSSFVLPDWIPEDAWKGFEDIRKKLRKPLTDRARELTVKGLEELRSRGEDAVACLNQSVQRGYSGVFPVNRNDGRYRDGHDPKPVVESPEAKERKKKADAAFLERIRRENDIRLGLIPEKGSYEGQAIRS
jgi:hypothetical protein